jgi:hypothetical protein
MTRADREAMAAAIELLRADPELRTQLEAMLQTQPWEQVGLFAVGLSQVRSLRLRPWEAPPCDTANVKQPSDCYGARPNEVALLRKLLALGISRYHPDPMQALAAAEAKQPAA